MCCPISKQIAQHASEPESMYCLMDGCCGELTFESYHRPSFSEIYTCDKCGKVHYLDEEGLSHA